MPAPTPPLLDRLLPRYDAREVHERRLAAPAAAVWAALHATRLSEIRLAAPLMALRSLPRLMTSAGRRKLGGGLPALEALVRGGFVSLGETVNEEAVIGAIGQFWRVTANAPLRVQDRAAFEQFTTPGYVRVAMNFLLEPAGGGTRLITETRIQGTDPASAKAFRRYWFLIRLGSGAIRRSWLAAIARRLVQ